MVQSTRFAVGRAETALRGWWLEEGEPSPNSLSWEHYGRLIKAIDRTLEPHFRTGQFIYRHDSAGDGGKPYEVPLSFLDAGGEGDAVVAIGGLINVVQRFSWMAADALQEVRVIAIDLAGRGRSGWLRDLEDYSLDTYVAQLGQCLDHFGFDSCTLCGSSLGGSIALRFASKFPSRVRRIVLNDSAPFLPAERRVRRARAVARHYVFSSPGQMIRRTGAASKPFGPVPDSVLLYTGHHQTRWSGSENGRVYRHDLRAMVAYRTEAQDCLDLWREWSEVECPVLLLHGMQSDAISGKVIDRMREHQGLSVLHVANTGHTPPLCDGDLTRRIVDWMQDDKPFEEDRHHQPTSLEGERVFAVAE